MGVLLLTKFMHNMTKFWIVAALLPQFAWGQVFTSVSLENVKGSVTEFKVIKRDAGRCYLECHPITGRTHQIRIHLAGLGTPISGDTLYNGDKAERLFLHAKSLELTHPITGKKNSVSAPCNGLY